MGVRGRRWIVSLVALSLVVGCGEESPNAADEGDDAASPFIVDLEVDGYRAVTAGAGTDVQTWGSDGDLTHEPFTAMRRRGVDGLDGVVIVSVTGFEGQEGGLDQSAFGLDTSQHFSIDGQDAIYSSPDETGRGLTWADLVVVVGDDLAVRVTSPTASREQLLEWFERVEAHGQDEAPSIDPGDDLELIGTVGVDAAIASRADGYAYSDQVPGPEAALSVGWVNATAERESLALVALPGSAADLDALAVGHLVLGWRNPTIERGERAGARYLLIDEGAADADWSTRSIWMEAPSGDLLLARAEGVELPSRDLLLALLEGVHPTDEASWEALVIEATGGPGLNPDEGRQEIARGAIGEIEWLLQTAPIESNTVEEGVDPEEIIGLDRCIKLSDRTRACGGPSGSNFDWIASVPEPDRDLPPYVLLSTTLDAASVRVTTRTDQVTAPLYPVPGQSVWAALVFVDDPGNAGGCDDYPPGTVPDDHGYLTMRVDALDADGNVIGCLGFGPGSHEGGI